MAITAQLADGTRLEFPDGTDQAVIQQTVKNVISGKIKAPAEQPASVRAGSSLRDIPRQLGLTARYGLEGLAGAADILHEPIRAGVNMLGIKAPYSLAQLAGKAADAVGLPSPQGANERVIGDAARLVASAGGIAGGAGAAAAKVMPGVAQNVLAQMGVMNAQQAAGAAGAGLAGGSVREAGGGPMEQFAAAVLGGVAGGAGAQSLSNAGSKAATKLRQMMTPASVELQKADQTISLVLQRAGVDWAQVPERIKQGMRQEVADALNTGQPLNPDAVRRLLTFRRAEVTPTVGQLTQDPGLITRERNLSKTAANSTSPGLQTLPSLENRNVASLLRQLDDAGAANAPTASGAGSSAIGSLSNVVDRQRGNINQLYSQARDTSGRSLPLEGGTFTRVANQALDDANVGSFLPPDIARKMNDIAAGKYPLTVDVAEQLKTSIGNLQRGSNDGNMRRALGIVRQALDDTPLQNGKTFNPGNVPAVPGTVPPSTAAAGEESISAFNAARRANREWMARVESNPALRAVVEGVEPDQFVQRYIVGKGATAADVQALRSEIGPEAVQSLRSYMVRYLRDKATGGDQDITKFAGATYRSALRDIEDKLPAFFTREEIQKLRDLGDAAKYMQAQPAGSAVNNSNSGALLIGRGLDMLESMAQKMPLGLKDTLTGTIQGMQQRQVLQPRNALIQLAAPQSQAGARLNPLLAIAASGLNPRENDRRD